MIRRAIAFLFSLNLYAVNETSVDAGTFFVGNERGGQNHIQFESRFYRPKSPIVNLAILRAKVSKREELSLGLGCGHRKRLQEGYSGFHFIVDHTYLFQKNYLQVGPYVEFVYRNWGGYINGYCPFTHVRHYQGSRITPLFYADVVFEYRAPIYKISVIPNIDFTNLTFGIVTRMEIPTRYGSFFFDCGKDRFYGDHARIGFNFHIYGPHYDIYGPINRPIGITHKIKYPPRKKGTNLLPFRIYRSDLK